MAFWNRRRPEDRDLSRQNLPAVMFGTTGTGEAISERSALCVADVFACVRLLAESAAILPLHTYRRDRTGGRRRIQTATSDLLEAPGPATTTSDLVGQAVSHLATWGSCFVGKYRRGDVIYQLGLLDPARMTVEIKAGQPVYTYYAPDGSVQQRLTVADVVHVRMPLSLDGVTGLSPIRQARVALGLAKSLAEHGQNVMANGALPAGVLKVQTFSQPTTAQADGTEPPNEMDALRDAFQGRHQGTQNAGRIAVLSGEVEFVPLSISPDDLQYLEQRRLSTLEIARLFRIPPHFLGASSGESYQYSNVEQSMQEFVTLALLPYLTAIERSLSRDADLFAGGEYAQFATGALLRGDHQTRAEFYAKALDPIVGWMDRQEVRDLEDLPPEDAPAPPPSRPVIDALNGNGAPA